MPLRLTGTCTEITDALNGFPAEYHRDYSEVRPIARTWSIEPQPTAAVVSRLTPALRRVLTSWGAGRRKAPTLRREEDFDSAFVDARLHRDVVRLVEMCKAGLGVDAEGRRLVRGSHVPADLREFDDTVLSVLREISQRLFVQNTSITYPTKVLLLISGLMPALDNRVRAGLGRAGFSGMNKTQFSLPVNTASGMEGS